MAVASPKALPIPRIIPAKIPEAEEPITILKLVWAELAPKAMEEWMSRLSTASIAFIDNVVIVGIDIIAKTMVPDKMERPPKVSGRKEATAGQMTPTPNKP